MPNLTRSANRSRMTRHQLTRLGMQVMLIGVFGILGGALNGLNLLIVVAAICLGALFVQWRVSRGAIDALRVERRWPAEIFAGKRTRVNYHVTNHHWMTSLWLLRIEERISDERATEQRGLTRGRGSRASISTAIGKLPAGQSAWVAAEVTLPRRGRFQVGRWRASTIAPLALSTAWREGPIAQTSFDVYPQLLPLARDWRSRLPTREGNLSANAQRHGPADDVYFGLREYRAGDSPRHIHWRTTARLGEPAVRQFEQQRRYQLCFLLDLHADGAGSGEPIPAVEQAISLAASLAVELGRADGVNTIVAVAGREAGAVSGGGSSEGLRRILRLLAEAQPHLNPQLDLALQRASEVSRSVPDLVVLSTRNQPDAVRRDPRQAAAVQHWNRQGRLVWLRVDSRDVSNWVSSDAAIATPTQRRSLMLTGTL